MNQQSRINHLLKEKDHTFYGQIKDGQATSPNLVIRQKNGNQLAFGYHYLAKEMQYNPSTGITLYFLDPDSTKTIHIQGRNLLPLWDALVWHKITFIQELEHDLVEADEKELCIEVITIT